ncbi:MAG: hypothetical protein LBC53_01000 [Spirochaetaceae bacterium]|jgi:hypothetical protein|nr:hypothetical protein [Spirochaetaceae bacterium]
MENENKLELNVSNNKVRFKRFVIKDIEVIKPMTNSHLIGVRSEYKYIKHLHPNSKDIYFDTSEFFDMRGKDKGKPQI